MPSKVSKSIFTVGHSTLSAKIFLELLAVYDIQMVVDVRRFPGSKKNPQYQKKYLNKYLLQAGLNYHWLGEQLGGFRTGGYFDYMKTNDFQNGIAELEDIALGAKTAVMCAEKLYFRCHRRFIADELVRRSWRVIHIVDMTHKYEHKLQEDLFAGQNDT
jgi:uncharacterized protein (DUF488 family)